MYCKLEREKDTQIESEVISADCIVQAGPRNVDYSH